LLVPNTSFYSKICWHGRRIQIECASETFIFSFTGISLFFRGKETRRSYSLLSIFCFSSVILSSASWLAMAYKLRTAFSNLTLVGVGKYLYQGTSPIIGARPSMKLSPADWNSFILGEGAVNKLRRLPKMNIPIPEKSWEDSGWLRSIMFQ